MKDGREICGFLVDNGYFIELIPLQNTQTKGGGTFHSHPTYLAEPGESDIKFAVDDSLMLVIDVLDKKVGLWSIKDKQKKKLRFTLI